MATATTDEHAYREHEQPVLRVLSARYRDDLDPDACRELYHEAWVSVLKRRREGRPVTSLRAYLIGAADKLAAKRVYGADARRRLTFDPAGPFFARLADGHDGPADRLLASDEARRLRLVVSELGDGAEAAVLRLRLHEGLAPAEIRDRLGLTDRQYRRSAERAGEAVRRHFNAFDSGDWARRQRSLLTAVVMGVASERQRAKAARLVASDPICRAMLKELRELGVGVAALVPVPVALGPATAPPAAGWEHLAEALSTLRRRAADAAAELAPGSGGAGRRSELLASVRRHGSELYMRAADPTPLAGARPGAAVAVLAGCVAAGTGAFCAVDGTGGWVGRAVGVERSAAHAAAAPDRVERRSTAADRPVAVVPPSAVAPPPRPDPTTPDPAPAPAARPVVRPDAPDPPPPAAAPVAEGEYEPGYAAAPRAAAAGSPGPPRPAPRPAAAAPGSGEFAP